jgi:nicotinate-nucleotide adenylyltransferase
MSQEEPDVKFVLIMGGDNLDLFRKWRNYDKIMEQYEVLVYPRPDSSNEVPDDYKNVRVIDAPLIEVSSTFIRESLRDGKDVRFFMPQSVAEMMSQNSFL